MHQHQPHPLLGEYVECLWRVERDFRALPNGFDILPDSYVELLFMLGAPGQLHDGSSVRELPRCCLIGLLNRPVTLRADGVVKVLAVRFHAWGLLPLMGFTAGQPHQHARALDDTLQHLAASIEQISATQGDEAATEHLHAFLITQALHATYTRSEVQAAARMLAAQGGSTRIDALADACHLSRRQMERQFNAAVGVSPKMLARTMRFQQARNALWHTPHADLAALAAELGYADQAHFSREFKAFSQRTPARFATEARTARATLNATHVAFVQDA